MTKRMPIAIAVGAICLVAVIGWYRSRSAPISAPVVVSPTKENQDWDRPVLASHVPPLKQPMPESPSEVPAPAPLAAPIESPAAPENSARPPKSKAVGFARARLPVSERNRSAPTVHASPALQEAYQARSSRAAFLDRRLERHIAELRTRLASANAAERASIEHDLPILEAQLAARRPFETPAKPAR